ncbi:(deoxy)nucleoside triphosphate pyrophosphohydrolase [Haloglycomyces albus]|uniref:(deoxy)nucleoside triphosphate pyrophosphohydrolase n=1 Tax=Haloglycomyces albus TaxID=526067 RepID=UPI00046D0081|nr:(deoxy)nucleoside triphosphate pyrophosphohydrolase [Haloglycomyces albus]
MPDNRTVVVAAAIVDRGRVLAAQRSEPPALRGGWEFPGGKVEVGETELDALVRECEEELGVGVVVGDRIGPDLLSDDGRFTVRVFECTLHDGDKPTPLEHLQLRWLDADSVDDVDWLPANAQAVKLLPDVLKHHAVAPTHPGA